MAYNLQGRPVSQAQLAVFLDGCNLANVKVDGKNGCLCIETETCNLTLYLDAPSAESLLRQLQAYLDEELRRSEDNEPLHPEGEPLTAQQIRSALKPGDLVPDCDQSTGFDDE